MGIQVTDPQGDFDYIIVGSGSAGSLIASRLTEDSACKVLVIEAGGPANGFWLHLPVGYFKSIYDSRFSRLYKTEAGASIAGRQIDAPRGRVVGGSSSINGLIFIRGQHEDFNDWAAMGADGWSYQDVLPHFRRFESFEGPPSTYRGQHGGLNVSLLRNQNPACDDWIKAALGTGLPPNPDFNAASSYGIGNYQLTLKGHWRESAETAFLRPALARPNLSLMMHAHVTRVVIENGRAVGVEYIQNGARKTVCAGSEVILAAGAVQSPQILQLSGIGPAALLASHAIDVIHDAPEVGENLQDHLQMRTIVELTDTRDSLNDHLRNPFKLAKMGLDWLFGAKGPLTVGAGQVGGAVCTKYSTGGRPDLQLFVMPLSVDKPGTPLHRYSGFTTSFWQCHPESRGHIRITSADPMADPIIQPNYLSHQKDRDVMIEGLKLVRDIYNRPEFRKRWKSEVIPGAQVQTDAEILGAIQRHCSTVYHLSGTCRMGSDARAVVDPELRVNGVEGLRVIDASIMPKITAANTNAPTYMIAEKGANLRKDVSMTITIYNPANPSEVVASYTPTPLEDLDQMFAQARNAQRVWAKLSQIERGKRVNAFLDGLAARTEDIAISITKEMGKTLAEARGEVAKALGEGRACTQRAGNPVGEVYPSQKPDVTAYSTRRPRGVILGINPWNFPFSTPIRKTIPALVYGNAMILKPSISTPGAAFIMQEVADATLPAGVFQVVLGSGAFGAALTARPELDGISFTGSIGVGKIVAEAAARNLTEISLELGGKNPVILNDASDLDAALDQIFAATFAVCGQRCTGISRVIVHASLHDAAVAGLVKRAKSATVGDGMNSDSKLGPLISATQLRDVAGFVDRARAEGAVVMSGGEPIDSPSGGYFFAPTILAEVKPAMEIATQEVFGPVLAILKYQTLDQALKIANGVEYGLSACLYSEKTPVVQRFIAEINSGMIHVNAGSFPEDHLPFVGLGQSSLGVGGSNGPSTIQFYTSEHTVYLKAQA